MQMNKQNKLSKRIIRLAFLINMFSFLFMIGCEQLSQQKVDEYSLAYDSTAKLAYILWLSMPAHHTGITPQMETFLQSNQYEKLSDPQRQQLMREAFKYARKASSEQSFEAGQAIAKGTINVVTLCSLYCFPECKDLCNKSEVPMEQFFDVFQKLTDRGGILWSQSKDETIKLPKQRNLEVPITTTKTTVDLEVEKMIAYGKLYPVVIGF